MTLTEFLLARIADTERAWDVSEFRTRLDPLGDGGMSMAARVLAECEAKRRIVALEDSEAADSPPYWSALSEVLSFLALPYADHPDYREEWKP